MKQILLVEESTKFGQQVKARMEADFDLPVYWAKSLSETVKFLEQDDINISMALLDYHLTDDPDRKVLDELVRRGITSLVSVSDMSDEVRTQIWSQKAADYILKDDPNSLDYIITAMKRLEKNEDSRIVVVDDSDLSRTTLVELLQVQKFRVLTAKNGTEALALLGEYPDIKLLVTSYNIPEMDGCQLCQQIRADFKQDTLAILGICSEEDRGIGARFIKGGANDFLIKNSFLVEELYCRVNQCVESINIFAQLKDAVVRDIYTGLCNRRYFFDAGEMLFASSRRDQISLVCAIVDIDFFAKINHIHGYDAGDQVIQHVAKMIQERMRTTDIVAHFGGGVFCVLAVNMEDEEVAIVFEEIRQQIEDTPVFFDNNEQSVQVSVSIGICTEKTESLGLMTTIADTFLHEAKTSGRNCIRISAPTSTSE